MIKWYYTENGLILKTNISPHSKESSLLCCLIDQNDSMGWTIKENLFQLKIKRFSERYFEVVKHYAQYEVSNC